MNKPHQGKIERLFWKEKRKKEKRKIELKNKSPQGKIERIIWKEKRKKKER